MHVINRWSQYKNVVLKNFAKQIFQRTFIFLQRIFQERIQERKKKKEKTKYEKILEK